MKWRIGYYKLRLKHILGKKDRYINMYNEMVQKSDKCKDTRFNRFDFLCSFILFGAEPEDYFSYNFYEHRNPFFRNHHVTRVRLKYLKPTFNTAEAIAVLDSKSDFNKIYDEFLGRKWCCPKETDEETFVNLFKGDNKEVFVKLLSGSATTSAAFAAVTSF